MILEIASPKGTILQAEGDTANLFPSMKGRDDTALTI